MATYGRLSEHIVEDGFSLEGNGYSVRKFREYFRGLPREVLERLLAHFNNRNEWEVCRIIRDLMQTAPSARVA